MIIIYSLEKDIDFQKEKKLFRNLYYKHGVGYRYLYGKTEWELPEEER